jgi:glycerol-3-phosphate dehydrogenase (NAD(P)+)
MAGKSHQMDSLDIHAQAHAALHARAREQGVNKIVYRIARSLLVPFFRVYFRMQSIGIDHIPEEGGAIIAANHRSFLDPFIIGACAHRPLYFVAKKELFKAPWQAWVLNCLGAFPVDRGNADEQTITTAKAILARGDIVLIFPEGTRIRPGTLGKPKRGVGRLALEAGVPVIPIAVTGTEAVRRGWRIRPHKVRVRAGRPLHFPQVDHASPELAIAVTNRIWPCVALQWEWLGGLAPIRRACVIGAGSWGTSLAVSLARAGYDVDLGCRTAEQARQLTETRVNSRYLPGVELPPQVNVVNAGKLDLYGHDLICLAVPAASLPAVMDAHGDQIPHSAGVLVLSKGSLPSHNSSPSAYVGERSRARALAVLAVEGERPQAGALAVVASADRGFARQISDVLKDIGMSVTLDSDVSGLERRLAGDVVDARAA